MSGLSLTHLSGNSRTKLRTLERMEGRRKIKKIIKSDRAQFAQMIIMVRR